MGSCDQQRQGYRLDERHHQTYLDSVDPALSALSALSQLAFRLGQ